MRLKIENVESVPGLFLEKEIQAGTIIQSVNSEMIYLFLGQAKDGRIKAVRLTIRSRGFDQLGICSINPEIVYRVLQ